MAHYGKAWPSVMSYSASATPPRLPAIRQGETRNEKGERRNERGETRNEKPERRNEKVGLRIKD